ncbi:shikimate dehydrogenase (NADP(+)) [Tenuifilaceae bacterium CYCD]|nr:shikimate dehydrogenase (NADP(+)) [Tenuifilaceae bacterium CYCD]
MDAFYTRIRALSGKDVIEIIKNLNISGANITTPFKEEVMPYLDFISDDAKLIGGVNTIVNADGKLSGYNTDHFGVTRSLIESGLNLNGLKCLILGAGPAARAAVYGLVKNRAEVTVSNRTHSKAQLIANDFGCRVLEIDKIKSEIGGFDVVVSTLLPDANPISDVDLPSNLIILDANYRMSNFGIYAEAFYCKIISGKRWLINQAVESYKYYFGVEPDVKLMEKGLNVELEKNSINAIPYSPGARFVSLINVDIVISLPAAQVGCLNTFLDEEVCKVFGS